MISLNLHLYVPFSNYHLILIDLVKRSLNCRYLFQIITQFGCKNSARADPRSTANILYNPYAGYPSQSTCRIDATRSFFFIFLFPDTAFGYSICASLYSYYCKKKPKNVIAFLVKINEEEEEN